MQTTTDVLIIGGGVIGCAIAYALRQQGITVVVLERGEIGGQASGAAAGLLAPLGPLTGPGPFANLVLTGFSRLIDLLPELEAQSSIQVGYERSGALRVIRQEKRAPRLRKRLQDWKSLGMSLYWLDGDEARKQEPLLTPDVYAAIYAPEESQVRATDVVRAFALAASKAGANIYSQQEVVGTVTHRSRVQGVRTASREQITCQWLVLAPGAWIGPCLEWLNVKLPVRPLHGQLLAFEQPASPLKHIVFGEAIYLVPRREQILVGATKSEMGFDTRVTVEGTTKLAATARRLAPILATHEVRATWAGLRPWTPDHQPVIDFLPAWENVVLAAGHNSVGLILSALTGDCVAEMLLSGSVPSIVRPFSVGRFSSMEVPH
ncbi:glycine oxidase ThiO [Ktedonospora formicarum]|uniref:glycine oxidase n=1 Tax=Ktedonospora formicarum TaxID=2778364 RepID=A0A8J3I1M3_9CHLR|nr:glycine oxidase ThiO [Ktedonospora formicarum]GHO44587.1 glycine oxidase ThiO [Ktedonospora formicarum]